MCLSETCCKSGFSHPGTSVSSTKNLPSGHDCYAVESGVHIHKPNCIDFTFKSSVCNTNRT